jgi:hypothetical protein
MRHHLISFATAIVATVTMFSCAENATEPKIDATASTDAMTRVDNPKTVMVYVETNDINPLNAITYEKTNDGKCFIDILNLFAANINKVNGEPAIHFNQELAPIMADVNKYIRPIQEKGIKVCLTLLPNWQNIGFANLTGSWNDPNSQVRKFARLVAYVICTYGLDGVNCDDEYAGYSSTVSGSYGNFIKALRAELDAHCGGIITVFQYGNTGQIDATVGAMIDYVDYSSFRYDFFGSSNIAGVANSRFMPVAINLGNPMPSTYSTQNLGTIRNNARRVVAQGYAGVMGFNLRDNGSAQPVFNAWAQGLYNSTTNPLVEWTGVNYPQDQTFIPGGHTITNADVPANF